VTEAEWLAETDPEQLLGHLGGERSVARHVGGRRKLRLFACACCRRAWHHLADQRSRDALVALEAGAGDAADTDALRAARQAAGEAERAVARSGVTAPHSAWAAWMARREAAGAVAGALARRTMRAIFESVRCTGSALSWERLSAAHASGTVLVDHTGVTRRAHGDARREASRLLRDIFGSPFRATPAVDPAWLGWRDGAVSRLARAAYDDRRLPEGTLDSARLAVLADALEDAGCTDPVLLGHLRGPGPHVRGCWAVDLVLGKE
jgi:hypothetical protein